MLLACHSGYQENLRKELGAPFESEKYTNATPQKLLDASSTRHCHLYQPTTFSSQAVTPVGGMSIGNKFIPEDTLVSVATYSIHHVMVLSKAAESLSLTYFKDATYFAQADELIPERWSSKPEPILNKGAFIPFSVGTYSRN